MTDQDQPIEDIQAPGLFSNLLDVLWQRRAWIVAPTILAAIGGAVAVMVIKPEYESKATILIESQQLPESIATTPVNDMIDERIARVRQRVLSRPDLVKIIRDQNLYPDERKSQPLSAIVERMRAATEIEAVSADVQQGRGMQKSTIAFTISFDYPEPGKAQAVAQQYVNNFLELDAASQTEAAIGAATFLNEQAADIQSKVRAIEAQITDIKARNGSLLAMQSMSTGNPIADAARIDSEIAAIQSENARTAATPSVGASPEQQMVTQISGQLAAAQAKYSDSHPDVQALRAQLETAKAAARAASSGTPNVSGQIIAGNNARIASLRAAKGMILSQGAASQANAARAPVVAEQVAQLQAQADGYRAQMQGIGQKQMAAQVSARMETEQKGERLILSDPPVVPDQPVRPNRPMLLAGSTAAGLAFGLALVLAMEFLFRPIRGTASLTYAAGRPPLVVIPQLGEKPHFLLRLLQARSRRKLAKSRATA